MANENKDQDEHETGETDGYQRCGLDFVATPRISFEQYEGWRRQYVAYVTECVNDAREYNSRFTF